MNKPRKKRRWASELVSPLWTSKLRHGTAILGIHRDEAAATFAALVSEFVFLEHAMELVLSQLLGTDNNAASHVSRKIVSPAVRVEVMRALLEFAPHNKDKPDCYDEIITEFKDLSILRNQYVHGRWETCEGTGQLYLVRPKEDDYALGSLIAERFDLNEMQSTRARILDLWSRIYKDIGVESAVKHHK